MAPAVARVLAAVTLVVPAVAVAQEIEPRAFSNAPVGVNFLLAGYAHTSGGLARHYSGRRSATARAGRGRGAK